MSIEDHLDEGKANCYVAVYRGAMTFRFGPYTPKEMGRIMTLATEHNLQAVYITDCGPVEFDLELAKDLRGYPEGSPELEEQA